MKASRNTAHTPGPWILVLNENEEETSHVSVASDDDAHAIACVCGELPKDEDDANARLIAAAPDLLEACERLLHARLKAAAVPRFTDFIAVACDAMEVAVAKARGAR